ncbi:MAG: hypothetical protein ACR2QC_11930 [Gammaproteobacteria bacterium]
MEEQIISLPYNFDPWPHQEEWFLAFYDHGIRRFFEVVHRRGGKDKAFLNLMIDQMTQRVGNYVHVFPQRKRAKLIVWEGIDSDGKRYIDHFPPDLIYRGPLEQEMMISLRHPDDWNKEGSIYRCMGSDRDVYLLVGANPVAVIWSEYPEINPRMRTLVLPILRRNNGWEAIVCTPRGRNHAYRLFHRVRNNLLWHTSFLTIKDTVDHEGESLVTEQDVQEDIEAGLSVEEAAQEYYLEWDTPMPGAYYGEEFRRIDQESRIRHVPYDPSLPVYTSWDIGINDTNAIWFFQVTATEVRFIDYLEDSSVALVYEGDDDRKGWIKRVREKPYNYDHSRVTPPLTTAKHEVHYGPHDLENRIYATGKTVYGIALQHGLRFTVVPSGTAKTFSDGIAATRRLLARAVFDETNCQDGIDAARSYRREFNEKSQRFEDHEHKDWSNNGADSLRHAAIGLMPPREPLKDKPKDGSFEHMRKVAIAAKKGKPIKRATFKVYS